MAAPGTQKVLFEDRDAMKNKPFDGKGAQSGKKKA